MSEKETPKDEPAEQVRGGKETKEELTCFQPAAEKPKKEKKSKK